MNTLKISIDALRTTFVRELSHLYEAEMGLIDTLPQMSATADSPKLRGLILQQLEVTRHRIDRINQVFRRMGVAAPNYHHLEVGSLSKAQNTDVDISMIGVLRISMSSPIAIYQNLTAYAHRLGLPEVESILGQSLDQCLAFLANLEAERQIAFSPIRDNLTY